MLPTIRHNTHKYPSVILIIQIVRNTSCMLRSLPIQRAPHSGLVKFVLGALGRDHYDSLIYLHMEFPNNRIARPTHN